MNHAQMSLHLATRMGLPAEIGSDGVCYITMNGEQHPWDLFGAELVFQRQRNFTFRQWANQQGLPTDPQACAIATGYIE